MPNQKDLAQMKKHLHNAQKSLEYLTTNAVTFEKHNDMLEVAAIQFELAVLDFRKLCEKNKVPIKKIPGVAKILHSKEVYGEIEVTENGWLHIRINTLLPNSKRIENSRYISDSIIKLLDSFVNYGGTLPFFEKAFLAIIERCDLENRKSFDHDNKSYKSIQNVLKGRLFADDNQFELSLGLFTELDSENACHIYVMPENEAADFLYIRREESL